MLKLSLRVEALCLNLGKTAAGVIGTDGAGLLYTGTSRKIDNDAVIGRVGLAYRF